jgi:hypothetical protein
MLRTGNQETPRTMANVRGIVQNINGVLHLSFTMRIRSVISIQKIQAEQLVILQTLAIA